MTGIEFLKKKHNNIIIYLKTVFFLNFQGIHKHIAQLAINLMLDTFSNYDYINLYNFSEHVYPIVDCFKDTLVRATPNNIKIFKENIDYVHLEGHENFTKAFNTVIDVFDKVIILNRCR